MKKINLAITGCMGRMGKHIIKSARSDKNFKVVTLTENRIIKKKINGIRPSLNTEEAFKKANLIIDFSVPKCTFEVLKNFKQAQKESCYWNNRIFKKRGKFNKKILEKNTNS